MRARSAQQSPNPLTPTAVYGLDLGRQHARRSQRRRRVRDRAITWAMAIALASGVIAGAWFGYQVYLDHANHAAVDFQRGVDEIDRKHANESMDDIIDSLDQAPTFNGPGAPALGIGQAPATTAP
jgi:hypothetical protein